ncbi:single-strand DNA-binding protein [Paraburkholderia tropica]|uniref:single-stranded DNA-binding protein n=1 Tax=Paraburkholderia tropica TaxID=92647 RepID=UPI001621C4DF|nr:single-stranded DNA-binding protein [Paraburkholderia tropica]MBB3004429.1 single-strand DNA-binding protein [Paraburkholderia tropica]
MIQIFGLARVGRDVEVRNTTNGDAVASVSLAFSYGRKGDDGKKPTQWVDGALWGKRAEALAPYLTKGTLVTVACEDAHIETFQKQGGGEGVKLAARITAIDLAGNPPQAAQQPQQRQQQRQAPQQRQAHQNIPAGGGFDDMQDDVPF